jgi:ATP-dependent RNA helicase SUPV3L1/SUV3
VYLGPLRLLANEVFEKMNLANIPCNLLTGQEVRRFENANHTSSTIELADMFDHYDVAIVDEIQLISDPERGGSWTKVILGF